MSRPLVWFRADLRTRDHAALSRAAHAASDGVVGVFTICPKQWDEHDWAPIKVGFILDTLRSLRDDLESLGIPLRIINVASFNDVPASLMDLAEECECDSLWFNDEYEVNEIARDHRVERLFEENNFDVHRHHDQTVIPPADVQSGSGNFYTVFTPYKRAWWRTIDQLGGISLYRKPKRQPVMVCESDDIPDVVDGFDPIERDETMWPAGESAALDRLKKFIKRRIEAYDDQRDLPSDDGTSKLSPYLAIGSISARTCVHRVLDAFDGDPGEGADTWLSEIVWREFYRHVLVGYPRVCKHRAFKKDTERIRWNDSDADFDAWCNGQTGIPIVDAGMRQLQREGWMHNRVRMITAMFLTKNLLVDWRKGEAFFMRHLIDGDLASNNGGWQWSASTGTDAAPYFRIFNPVSQSKKFDAGGAYIREYVEELAGLDDSEIHEPSPLLRSSLGYPAPICDLKSSRQHAIEVFKAL